jgi:hypothetical protein
MSALNASMNFYVTTLRLVGMTNVFRVVGTLI